MLTVKTKIAIFTEGTILMHQNAIGHTREKIVQQVVNKEPSVKDYANYVPIGAAVKKIKNWTEQDATIVYMTSRREKEEVEEIKHVLEWYHFPKGIVEHREGSEKYQDVAERIMPDVLIEDDCESIGGENEMTFPHIKQELKERIKSIIVKEFLGIDHLPDDIAVLRK